MNYEDIRLVFMYLGLVWLNGFGGFLFFLNCIDDIIMIIENVRICY